MAKQDTAPADAEGVQDEDLVWVQSPATSRKKQVSPEKALILSRAGWTTLDEEPDADDPLIVTPFPTFEEGDPDAAVAAANPESAAAGEAAEKDTRAGRRAAADKEGS